MIESLSELPASSPSCQHCGLPVPANRGGEFCCSGCESVYRAIFENGLEGYYGQRGEAKGPPPVGRSSYELLDDPAVARQYVSAAPGGAQIELILEGVHCAACVWLVEKLPRLVSGVHRARLNFSESRLTVGFDPEACRLSEVGQTLARLGYPPHLDTLAPDTRGADGAVRREERKMLMRLGVAGAAFGNVMLASVALYSGDAFGMGVGAQTLFRWLSFLVTVPTVVWTAWPFFIGARAALITRTPHMDLPISIGVIAALVSGSWATMTGSGEIYFDSVTMLVFLLLSGRWLQTRTQRRAALASDLMAAMAPSSSRLLGKDAFGNVSIRERPTTEIAIGDLVEVRAGENISVDGLVVEGSSSVDASLLTGESLPVFVGVSAEVRAGTVSLTGRLIVRATVEGGKTQLATLVRELSEAARNKAPIVELANRISAGFVVAVLSLAVLSFLFWQWHGGEDAARVFISVLIVTCPCALGLATPLVGSVALGQAARAGLLIKGGEFLEQVQKPGLVVLDKTGTLTSGKLRLRAFDGGRRTAAWLRALESRSAHPVAAALLRDLPVTEALPVDEFFEVPGAGVGGIVQGVEVVAGTAQFVAVKISSPGLVASAELSETPDARRILGLGWSPLFVVADGRLVSVLGLGDPLRPDTGESLSAMRALGYRLAILSGDHSRVVQSIASELGGPFEAVRAEQSPRDKFRFIEEQKRLGPVIMIGDGVNDAAALASAQVGIAVHGGATASLNAADVFSTTAGLLPVVRLMRGSRTAFRRIRQNLAFSLAYNLVASTLAVIGEITPLWAAVLMPLSSLTVLFNSIRPGIFVPVEKAQSREREQ